MHKIRLSAHKKFLIGSILTGLIISIFALAPQIDLWLSCEDKCNGIYAIMDSDEPFYAAYLQSLMDGKPRRNSPYSGAVDSPQTPQKESGLYIQFLASYPLAWLGKVFNLSISQLMILTSLLAGFLSALAIYWLVYQFTEDNISAFVGTLTIIFLGATVGGQGATFSLLSTEGPHLQHNLIFLRRIVPAIGFPAMFLFIAFVWKFFNAETQSAKLKSAVFAFCSFTFCVFTYFYFWTTAFAWFFGLVLLLGIFHFEKLKENLNYILCFGLSLVLVLLPYFMMVFNRQDNIDSALFMTFTRKPDLWRLPEIVSYFTTALILIFAKFRLLDLKDSKIIFLLSLNLVTVVVFNQQIITGRSLQPFHYQFFCVNYLATFSLFFLFYILLKQFLSFDRLKLLMLLILSLPLTIGIFDTICGVSIFSSINLYRDKLVPISERIKTVSQTAEFRANNKNSVVMPFDLADSLYFNGIEIPALTSQPILWSLHLNLMPDISAKEDKKRLKQFLYYQNVAPKQLKGLLEEKANLIALGFFGGERISDVYTGKITPITQAEIDEIVADYGNFIENFNYEDAQNPLISFVLVNKKFDNDFTNLDRWYQRDEGEIVGDYILYQVKLRQP